MKAILLAGGFGTRLAEETALKPKPMVEIGGRPILWHIMKHLSHYGINEFIIAIGYKGELIKKYFLEYIETNGNISVQFYKDKAKIIHREQDNWTVHLEDTGIGTNTGGRVRKLSGFIKKDEDFILTYGDGLSNVNIHNLIDFHKNHGKIATITAVRPPVRFGVLDIDDNNKISSFREKSQSDSGWVNGGFMCLNQKILEYMRSDNESLEINILNLAAKDNELMAYKHYDFWQCVDNIRELKHLQALWDEGTPPWKMW